MARDNFDAADPVLKRDYASTGHNERRQCGGGCVRIPKFDGKEHKIYRTDLCRDICCGHPRQVEIAGWTLYPEPALAHRSEVSTACNETNVLTYRCKAGADVTTEAAGAHDRNAHDVPPPPVGRRVG
jgi:hypothetical protein